MGVHPAEWPELSGGGLYSLDDLRGVVDLGLPDGTLFALYNIVSYDVRGKKSKEAPCYGQQFYWASTKSPMKLLYAKQTGYVNVRSYRGTESGLNQISKYCYSSSQGLNRYTDTLSVLQTDDDAATVLWGDNWRMPTHEELAGLVANTTVSVRVTDFNTYVTFGDGVNYLMVFHAPNGRRMYSAVGGFHFYNNSPQENLTGFWSSSLCLTAGNSQTAWAMDIHYFRDGKTITSSIEQHSRYNAFWIRPVLKQ